MDVDTARAYRSGASQFLAWLAAAMDAGGVDGEPLSDPDALRLTRI